MSKTIWKFEIGNEFIQRIEIPSGYKILTVQPQFGRAYIWALVDPEMPTETVTLNIYGTGHLIPNNLEYVDTWQEAGGNLVWHLFIKP